MKHILFISYDGMTDPLGQSQVIPYLSGLTRYGYRFTILSCDKPEKYAVNKNYVEELLHEASIKWVSIPYHKSPPVLSSIYDYRKLKAKAKEIYQADPFDMVHTRPGLPTLAALWLKKKFAVKFLDDVRGFWADERVDGGMWNLGNPVFKAVYSFFKRHENECLEKADYVTCLTYAAKTEMLTWKHIKKQPLNIEVIPCSADLQLFDPSNINRGLKEQFRQELKISDGDIIFSYLGSIGGWYLTEEMMRLCKMIADKIPAAKFLFISPHRHEVIEEAAAKQGVPSAKIMVRQAARHEVPVLLSFSHYALFFIKPCYSKISSSPTKHGEIMAMGIPVITNSGVGDVEMIVNKYNSGFVLKDFSARSFAEVVNAIASGKTFDKAAVRKGASEFYALGEAIERYRKVYKSILG
ncbi:MAG: glycosyltransferase [Bacteroidetes bacterium]|nr:glycosyltransferase [Bacteroidota bacterium]